MSETIYIVVRQNFRSTYRELPNNYSWYFNTIEEATASAESFRRCNPHDTYSVIPLTKGPNNA